MFQLQFILSEPPVIHPAVLCGIEVPAPTRCLCAWSRGPMNESAKRNRVLCCRSSSTIEVSESPPDQPALLVTLVAACHAGEGYTDRLRTTHKLQYSTDACSNNILVPYLKKVNNWARKGRDENENNLESNTFSSGEAKQSLQRLRAKQAAAFAGAYGCSRPRSSTERGCQQDLFSQSPSQAGCGWGCILMQTRWSGTPCPAAPACG